MDRLGLAAGLLPVLVIALVYGIAMTRNLRPAGHPMVALMWGAIGYMTFRRAMRGSHAHPALYWITIGITAVGGLLWLLTTLQLLNMAR